MTTLLNRLTQAGCIVLLFMLFPGISLSQEQDSPVAQQPENAGKPAPQDQASPGIAATPEKQPQEQTEPQKGAALPAAEPVAAEPTATAEPTAAAEPAAAPAPAAAQYTIKQGDTLWDIANTYLKDPFLWPFIWKANPGITNPDLIYAGNNLSIPSMAPIERAMQAPAEAAPKEAAKEEAAPVEGVASAQTTSPKPAPPAAPPAAEPEETAPEETGELIMPEERPVPIIDKYSMLRAGFVNSVENEGSIVGAAETGKTTYGYDDIVYVKVSNKENVNVGDKYLIYAPLQKVRHPKTGKKYGRLIRGMGILQITAKDSSDVLTARITLSFDAIDKNDLLTPYQEPALVYPPKGKRAKDISGYILEVADHHSLNGQSDIVYLDKGSADGVEPGDRFLVYAEPAKKGFPRKKIGEVQVFLVKELTATAVVTKSREEMGRGNQIDFEQ
jgi:LysM repeat protein